MAALVIFAASSKLIMHKHLTQLLYSCYNDWYVVWWQIVRHIPISLPAYSTL